MNLVAENTISVGLHLLLNSASSSAERLLIGRWRAEYEKLTSEKNRRQKILDAVRDGYDTRQEIEAATGIHVSTVRRILLDLERLKLVESKHVKISRKPERRFYFVDRGELAISQ